MDVLQFLAGNDGAQVTNGRVKLFQDSPATPYGLFTADGKTTSQDGVMTDSLRQVDIDSSVVGNVFFARENVEALQLALRHGVYKASGREKITVGRQSDVELGIIMRSTYFEETRKPSMTLSQHVVVLNRKVLSFCVPRVLNEARGYLVYRESIQSLPTPMAWGSIETMKGSRQIIGSRLYGD